MIVQLVTELAFHDAFRRIGREDNFSRAGLGALYDLLHEWANESGEPVELDVIGLCTEWCEYDSIAKMASDYGITRDDVDDDDDDEWESLVLAEVSDDATVVPFDGGWLVGP